MLSAKQRDSNLLAYDDIVPPYTQRSISLGKPSSPRKSSETDNALPVPMHTRAVSTPAHIEAPRKEAIHASHKRYPSCVETSPRKETKKFSADNYITRNTDDRHSKRAQSESKEKITKRNASSPAGMSLLGGEKMHRFDDRGKSPMKHNQSLPLKATQELLAELLRGSSEKMTTAERERNKKMLHVDAYALPSAVQQFLVSVRFFIVVAIFTIYRIVFFEFDFVCRSYSEAKMPETTWTQPNLQLENKYRILNVCKSVQTNMTYSMFVIANRHTSFMSFRLFCSNTHFVWLGFNAKKWIFSIDSYCSSYRELYYLKWCAQLKRISFELDAQAANADESSMILRQ